ncbi:uncharacterized protein LOC109123361 [Vitis vinifera]|uniref:uncharacterized protein LOC109123361 n=1 Tax=Vitis vinifera TaxID=29760 RepID=UPI0008FED3FF|nr:uncharacterized protein LOC109123361 [Vitis vinifera]|eukprot:XP_019078445.1 PREDICTED: uncharacterized protein LOC109123361 [Vitis vinifera]
MANAHRRNNSLDRIKINGVWMTKEQEIREGIVSAFQQVLSEEPGWRTDIEGLHFKCLSSSEAETLEVQFTAEEIYAALMGMNGDKASGPDGFTIAFWQSSWEKEGLKIWVISEDQNAFVRGKQILDVSLIANEVIDFWHKRNEKGLICKLDTEKAYDSINWNFLMKVLVKMGFGSRWLEWIWWCISTAKFSVMINGVSAGFFSNSKGLRQGDPLSPYLFVLGMEVLSNLIRRAVDGGVLSGCRIRGRGEEEMIVSHLLFADDTIIFCEASKEQLSALSWILAWFEAASGLRINLDKSVLIPVGEVEDIEELAVELGCKVGLLPTVYLGLPLGAHHKAVSIWDGEEFGWRTKEARGTYGVGVWKKIMKEAKWCWENTKFKVGKGTRVKFWSDQWCGNERLSHSFPQLYEMAVNRNATVNEMWDHSSGPGD